MNRKTWLVLIGILLICLCPVVCSTGVLIWRLPDLASIVNAPVSPTPSSVSSATVDALRRAQIPERDLYQIVPRLRKNVALPTAFPTPIPRSLKVGERDSFFVIENASTGKYRTVTTTLQVVSQHGLFWVENGMQFDSAALRRSAEFFDQSVYPTNLKYFGSPNPGLDGETRIHILNTRFQEAAGYFSSEDTYPRALVPFSNERNIIYMNIQAVKPGSDEYNGDLAHEFQHLIHHYQAQHETGWIDEGMGNLAIRLNGFPVGGVLGEFARNPDTQLNTWANDPQESYAHYAASYLFFNYTAERFGPDFTRAVIHVPRGGVDGVQTVLDQRVGGMRFEDLFAEWAVANYLNDPTVGDGRYAHANEKSFRVSRVTPLSQTPISRTIQMHQYAANYFMLQPALGDVTVYFTGTTAVQMLPVGARGGRWMWYSNRADLADMALTRKLDLTRATKGTLQFWTWFDIERDFDYAYVEASTDGGKTWDILPGKHTVTTNPNGSNYGHAFTGRSGVSDDKLPAQWVQEQMDLSAYVGKTILLRFEYITDDAYNAPGWAIDDITVPEIGYADGVEDGEGSWELAGFIRTDNVLPQRYVVQLVEMGPSTRIVRIPLDAQNLGSIAIKGLGREVMRATLVVTAFAPTTTEPAEYQIGIASR